MPTNFQSILTVYILIILQIEISNDNMTFKVEAFVRCPSEQEFGVLKKSELLLLAKYYRLDAKPSMRSEIKNIWLRTNSLVNQPWRCWLRRNQNVSNPKSRKSNFRERQD